MSAVDDFCLKNKCQCWCAEVNEKEECYKSCTERLLKEVEELAKAATA